MTLTHYRSQIGRRDLFWLQDAKSKTWLLFQQGYFKNGKPKSTTRERMLVAAQPEDITEENLFAIFVQAENDLVFHDAGGEKNPIGPNRSLRKVVDDFVLSRRG